MKGTAVIKGGNVYFDQNIVQYIRKHEDYEVEIEIIAMKKPEHYLYRYLFGFLIKDIANHSGESSDDVHDMMKDRFAKEFIEEWSDVPKHHRKNCDRYERENANGTMTRWYIKSCSDMTHEELMSYVVQVENHFFDFMEGAISVHHQKEAYELRKMGLMSDKELKKYRSAK